MLIRNSSISIKGLLRLKTNRKVKINLLDYNLNKVEFIYKNSSSNVILLETTRSSNRLKE